MSDSVSGRDAPSRIMVTYRVTPPERCPVARFGSAVTDVSVVRSDTSITCDIVHSDGEKTAVERVRHSADRCCPCSVVFEAGAIPHVTPTDSALSITAYVGDFTTGDLIADGLREVAPSVELVSADPVAEVGVPSTRIDFQALSSKQLEALAIAVDHGYYQTPSETTVEEMAADTEVSSSAFATRLRNAEEAVADQLFDFL
ncbi:MAG: helix-turn-helix domain-containing protein [Halanaeroarchaeum sp.]